MSFNFSAVVTWAKAHPWGAGAAVFGVGALAFLLLARQGGSSGGPDASLASYLNAQTAQNANDNAAQVAMSQFKSAEKVAGINADVQKNWAASTVAANASNNEAAQKVSILQYLGQLANNLGTVLTSSSNSASQSGKGGGLSLGFGGFNLGFNSSKSSANASSSTKQTLAVNEQQGLAAATLAQIANEMFHAGS